MHIGYPRSYNQLSTHGPVNVLLRVTAACFPGMPHRVANIDIDAIHCNPDSTKERRGVYTNGVVELRMYSHSILQDIRFSALIYAHGGRECHLLSVDSKEGWGSVGR